MSKLGNEKHESILSQTIKQLNDEGYRIIRLDGKSPTMVAINEKKSIAITILKKSKTVTITYLEDLYNMFDEIDRIYYADLITKDMRIAQALEYYSKKEFNVVILNGKSPDAIAYKNQRLFAIDIIGINQGYKPDNKIKEKEEMYDMFDGILLKTFNYDNETIFSQTFGSNKGGEE